MKIITAPERVDLDQPEAKGPIIALFGSIEMGLADNWQYRAAEELQRSEVSGLVLNPRRHDWDSTWEQKAGNPMFKEQVDWELAAAQVCTLAVFNFDPNTRSPITLFELGLMSGLGDKSVFVHCPEPYWRKGNVDIYCQRFGLKQVSTFEELLYELRKYCTDWV